MPLLPDKPACIQRPFYQWMLLLAVLLSPLSALAHKEPLKIHVPQHEYALLGITEYLEDPSGQLNIDKLLEQPGRYNWRPVEGTAWSFGLSDSAYWLHFDLTIEKNPDHQHFLEVHYPLLDSVELYITQQGRILQTTHAGDNLPFNERPLQFRNFLFNPTFPPGERVSVYLRVKSKGALLVPLVLWNDEEFYHHEQAELLIHGLYFGILLVFALHNLMLYAFNREPAFVDYTLYITSFGLFHASLFGFGYQYLWPTSPDFQHYSVPLFMLLAIVAALRFAHHFLRLPQTCPMGVTVIRILTLLALLLLFALPYSDYSTLISLSLALSVISASILLISSAVVWLRVRGAAGYFLLAWSIFLLTVIASASDKLGWGILGVDADRLMQFGLTLQVMTLSLALAHRMHWERKKRIAVQQQAHTELEKQVKERTEALEEANRRLDAMSHSDGLTGLRNRRFFDEELTRQFRVISRQQTQLSLLMIDIDHFKQINDRYGHTVGDDYLRLISAIIHSEVKRPMDSACRYGGEEFAIILPDTPREGANTIAECIRTGVELIRHQVGDEWVPVTISIGCATITPTTEQKPGDIILLADKALYQAKAAGRNRVVSC